ncbi:MAG: hypothetical protein QM715_01300 [Nibricoccus sp.]
MKFRIFQLSVELLPGHPQRTKERIMSYALGYTCDESVEGAKATLKEYATHFKVKIVVLGEHEEIRHLSDVKESLTKKYFAATEAYPYCHIEPFEKQDGAEPAAPL